MNLPLFACMNSYLIDPFEFCRNGESLKGKASLSELPRLAAICADSAGELAWDVSGSVNKRNQPQLLLGVSGKVNLMCQRCLLPLVFDFGSETTVLVARTEEQADEMEEALGNEDSAEVIVTDGKMNVLDLIEDEALLSLPLSSRHEVCPDSSTGEMKNKPESPFSVLGALKKKE